MRFKTFIQLLLIPIFFLILSYFLHPAAFAEDLSSMSFEGLIKPYEDIELGCSVIGIIDEIHVERGDIIKKGQLLVTLDAKVEKSSISLAQAKIALANSSIDLQKVRHEFAKREFERKQNLSEKNIISSYDLDESQTNLEVAEEALKQAIAQKKVSEQELKQTQEVYNRMMIHSPINGVMVRKLLSKGELVDKLPILRLVQLDPLLIEVTIPATYWSKITINTKAKIEPEIPLEGQLIGTVYRIDPLVDAKSGMFQVLIKLPNESHKIPVGLKCNITFLPSHIVKSN